MSWGMRLIAVLVCTFAIIAASRRETSGAEPTGQVTSQKNRARVTPANWDLTDQTALKSTPDPNKPNGPSSVTTSTDHHDHKDYIDNPDGKPRSNSALTFTAQNADVRSSGHLRNWGFAIRETSGSAISSATVEIAVSANPNDYVHLNVLNEITFVAEYLATGKRLRKIINTAWARDIDNKPHHFTLNVSYEKSTTATKSRGGSVTKAGGTTVKFGLPNPPPTVTVDGSESTTSTWSDSITSSSAPTQEARIEEVVTTEFSQRKKHSITFIRKIKSYAQVKMKAAGQSDGSNFGNHAYVGVDVFDVHNDVMYDWAREVWDPEPEIEWGNGGDSPNPVSPATGKPYHELVEDEEFGCLDGRGLDGEPSAVMGTLWVQVTEQDRAEELVFGILATPATRVDVPNTIVVPAGSVRACVPFRALTTGEFTLVAALLDANGDPTGFELTASGSNSSLLSETDTVVSSHWATDLVRDDLDGAVTVLAGSTDLPLVVSRLAYDGWETESTTVSISVSDPTGILNNPPSSITIAAGELEATLPISVSVTAGQATLTLGYGSQDDIEYEIHGVEQSLSTSATTVCLPINALMTLDLFLGNEAIDSTSFTATLGTGTLATVCAPLDDWNFAAGDTWRWISISANGTTGSTTLTISSAGSEFDSVVVALDVVAAQITVDRESVELLSMGGSAAGVIQLTVPDGVEFDELTGPTGSEDYLDIAVSEDGRLATLTFIEGETRPSSVECDVTFTGQESSNEFRVEVTDTVHGESTSYILTVDEPE